MGSRADIAEEIIMAKATVYYFTFFDKAKGTLGKQTCKIPGWTLKLARTRELSMLFAL
jgi:hypothetical protein